TAERDTASNRHCWDTGSTGFTRSTIARRSARLSCRAFVPKNRFRPSTGRSAGTEHRPAPRCWSPPPLNRRPRLDPRIMFLPCPLHVLLPRYPRVLGAGLHLSQLSHFRGPPHLTRVSVVATGDV